MRPAISKVGSLAITPAATAAAAAATAAAAAVAAAAAAAVAVVVVVKEVKRAVGGSRMSASRRPARQQLAHSDLRGACALVRVRIRVVDD